tara:strand:- start:2300 stop:2524 length:225 start_codon:yes stop_codon:yes gene_type:complete
MAKQTVQALHEEIGDNGNQVRIFDSRDGASSDNHLCDGRGEYPGLIRWVTVTHADSVADQVADIRAGLAAAGTS